MALDCEIVQRINFIIIMLKVITEIYEPSHEKTNNLGFRSGPTHTSL